VTVETAQRRLLEALADMHHSGDGGDGHPSDPLTALCLGLDFARHMDPDDHGRDPVGPVLTALEDLALAVRGDLVRAEQDIAWTPYGR